MNFGNQPAGVPAESFHVAARVTYASLASAVVCAMQSAAVFAAVRDRIKPEMVHDRYPALGVVWRALCLASDAHEAAGGLPWGNPNAMTTLVGLNVHKILANDSIGTLAGFRDAIEQPPAGILPRVFTQAQDPAVEREAVDTFAKFLVEVTVTDPVKRAFVGLPQNDTFSDPSRIMAMIERGMAAAAGINTGPAQDAIVAGVDFCPAGARVHSTGEEFLDVLTGGGHASSECYVVLAGTGAGKTALMVQLVVQSVLRASNLPEDLQGNWYYLSYELDLNQIRERVYAYGARIDRTVLNAPGGVKLSTAADPASFHAYEDEQWVNGPGGNKQGEVERIATFNQNMGGSKSKLRLVDYSGRVAGHGQGGVDEAVRFIRADSARCRRRVAGVVFDYAGLCIKRYIVGARLKPESEVALTDAFVDQVRSRIALPFDCPVWILHQLHGSLANKASGVSFHHSQARGARNIGDNADYALVLGNRDKTTNVLNIAATKTRRSVLREEPVIVHFDGRFGRFSQAEGWAVDPGTRQLVPQAVLNQLAAAPFAGQPHAQPAQPAQPAAQPHPAPPGGVNVSDVV